jgi:hypothetical protein
MMIHGRWEEQAVKSPQFSWPSRPTTGKASRP